jgi:hypothetical protein
MIYTVRKRLFLCYRCYLPDIIQAFGVILLEVGLWEPVFNLLQRYSGSKSVADLTPEEVKTKLLEASKAEAEHKCGSRYRKIIEVCLTSDFGLGDKLDTKLQTDVQGVFRQEILHALREVQVALTVRE